MSDRPMVKTSLVQQNHGLSTCLGGLHDLFLPSSSGLHFFHHQPSIALWKKREEAVMCKDAK